MDLYVYGAGGMGRQVFDLVEKVNQTEKKWNIKGFIDDGKEGKVPEGYKIYGGIDYLNSLEEKIAVVLGIADTKIKRRVITELSKNDNIVFPNIIHPYTNISKNIKIGKGCIICFSCSVATNVEIKDFVFMNKASHIGHDTVVGKYTSIMPSVNISGKVRIGECVLFGVDSTILQEKVVGDNAVIGAGATVYKDVPKDITVLVGTPGKYVKFPKK